MDDVGRVIDFAELKKLFKGWLDENWDHGFVLNKADENGLAAAKIVEPCRYFVLPCNPTSENMAIYFLHEVCPTLLAGTGVTASKVVIWESDESFAEASLSAPSVSSGTCGLTSAARSGINGSALLAATNHILSRREGVPARKASSLHST